MHGLSLCRSSNPLIKRAYCYCAYLHLKYVWIATLEIALEIVQITLQNGLRFYIPSIYYMHNFCHLKHTYLGISTTKFIHMIQAVRRVRKSKQS